ncbi:MAG: UDP-N-acetylmuramoyl-L-alanine--D-glutamate ligase, partial [Solirubrobacteraceae bacterium]
MASGADRASRAPVAAGSAERPPLPPPPHLVVGLARSGVAATRALRRRGLPVIGLDSGDPQRSPKLAQTVQSLRSEGVDVHVGVDGVELLLRAGSVVKSPGVPEQAPVIAAARRQGVPVIGELELAWRMLGNELMLVTGTNGKTTTVEMIAHVHREAGLPVALAGNVGLALSALVDRIGPEVPIVCEASSFQLHDTVELVPEIAVLLNLTPDHLDRHGSFEAYANAKLRAFARQRPTDVAILPAGLELAGIPVRQRIAELGCRARVICFDAAAEPELRDGAIVWREEPPLEAAALRVRGAHNVRNAMAAAAACLAGGVARERVASGLASFPGVKHRLEEVGSSNGVLYVNDSKATNVASTLVALAALTGSGPRRIHLILGGQRKGQQLAPLARGVRESCAGVYLIGEDAPALAEALGDSGVPAFECGELARAVEVAGEQARSARAAASWVAAARRG